MVRRKLNNQGFTFVELVIAVAILSVITVSIATFMATTSRVYSKTNHNNEVQSQAVEVYDQISNCIMQANKVIVYGYLPATSGGYEATAKFFISDGLPYAQGSSSNIAGYDENGNLVDSDNNLVSTLYKISSEASATPVTGTPERMFAFKSLKKDDGTGTGNQSIKEIKVKALYVEYQTKTGKSTDPDNPYETCYATFYVSDAGDLYLNRHYDSDPAAEISKYRINFSTSATSFPVAALDIYPKDSSLLCKTLEDNGFRVMVDADNNSIGLVLNFDNYTMTYDTLGMVKIRNKAVLTR